jgi:hypothetical protein
MQSPMRIQVTDSNSTDETLSIEEMLILADQKLNVQERVPAVQGEAFDLKTWYRSWKRSHTSQQMEEPTHVRVEAIDEFQALMPWSQLDQALFLYAQDGQPLQKGYPIRLYVPDGSSECLNVKSIVKIWFLHDANLGDEATYGFKNKVSMEELKFKK